MQTTLTTAPIFISPFGNDGVLFAVRSDVTPINPHDIKCLFVHSAYLLQNLFSLKPLLILHIIIIIFKSN